MPCVRILRRNICILSFNVIYHPVVIMLADIYHLETTDFNRWSMKTHERHLSSFQNITFSTYRCDVFEKKIDVSRGSILPTD